MYLSDIYTLSVNLAGLPGMSVPAGFNRQGRPVGLQIIGNYFGEAKMLNVRAPVPVGYRLAHPRSRL
jgi:aspartyl-tRNA(Asn)/glutamyl-tRNA(Gln) amidotransferase subunit A